MGKTIKADMKAKKAAVKAKLERRKAGLKAKKAAVFASMLAVMMLGGCAIERADPAARSNRATYTIASTVANSTNVTNVVYISDGLMATADGEGAITQPSTQTAEQSPETTVPGDALTAGIQAAGRVAEAAFKGKGAAAEPKAAAPCEGGACGETPAGN